MKQIQNCNKLKIIVFALLFLSILTCSSQKQVMKETSPFNIIESHEIVTPDAESDKDKPHELWDDIRITMDFQDAKLANILRIIAKEYKVNIAIPDDEDNRVSIYIHDANLLDALDMILASVDYSYYIKDNTILIHKNSDIVSRIYKLKYAKAIEMQNNLAGLSTKAHITADELTNSIVVTDALGNMNAYDRIIDSLDSFQPSVMIEAEIFEVALDNLRNLGIEWAAEGSKDHHGLVVNSPLGTTASNIFLNYTNLKAPQLGVLLSALKKNTETNLLSSPRIVTMNGQEAKILIGERVPYVRATTTTESGNVIQHVEFVDVGIVLNVTPRIVLEEKLVFIDVKPEVSKVLDMEVQGVPRIGTREASTRVAIKDNETVIIGGLVTADEVQSSSALALLEKIPLLKHLFRSTNNTKVERELVVFITPHILTKSHYSIMTKSRNELNEKAKKRKTAKLY